MGMLKHFLLGGDLGSWSSIQGMRSELRHRNRTKRLRQRHVDRSQDERIAALEGEGDETKLYVMRLLNLLVQKNVLTRGDLESLVEGVEQSDGNPELELLE